MNGKAPEYNETAVDCVIDCDHSKVAAKPVAVALDLSWLT